jgi:hypothetical protein
MLIAQSSKNTSYQSMSQRTIQVKDKSDETQIKGMFILYKFEKYKTVYVYPIPPHSP